jgi:hypothetical protein
LRVGKVGGTPEGQTGSKRLDGLSFADVLTPDSKHGGSVFVKRDWLAGTVELFSSEDLHSLSPSAEGLSDFKSL